MLGFVIYYFRDDPWDWILPVAFIAAGILLLVIIAFKGKILPSASNDENLSQEEYRRKYPYGKGFSIYFALPVVFAFGVMIICFTFYKLTKSETVTISSTENCGNVYLFFSSDKPKGVTIGRYIINKTHKKLILWRPEFSGLTVIPVKLQTIPPQSVTKIKDRPDSFAGITDFDNLVRPNVIMLSPAYFLDSIYLMPESHPRIVHTDDGLDIVDEQMIAIKRLHSGKKKVSIPPSDGKNGD